MVALWLLTLVLFVVYFVMAFRKHNRYHAYSSTREQMAHESSRKAILFAAVISAVCLLIYDLTTK